MRSVALACALVLGSIGTAAAATVTPVNMDPAGSGLNDPAAATPVGGNPGTTVGEQRRLAYQFAADLWGAVLQSNVQIRVQASFTPLTCSANSGVLGSAGAITVHRDFTNAPLAATWYGQALANAIAGTDLDPTQNDINSRFNSNLGTPGCLDTSGWYYGLDGKTPANRINFLDVVMHEIGHGLNFQGFHNLTTGAKFNGFTDVYSSFVFDNASGLSWNAMSNAQRVAAAKSDALVWTGATVTGQVPAALTPLARFFVTGTLTADYATNPAGYGPAATPANFTGEIVLGNDGGGAGTATDACEPLVGSYTGTLVLVDRGLCSFKTKTLNVQNAGGIGVIVANNVASGFPGMGDDGTITTPITIPSIGIEQAAGNAIKAALPGVNGAMQNVPGQYYGSDASSRARLYSPTTLESGSTFSHFDVSHTPNAIMEPSINMDLDANYRLDLTPALYQDEGWTVNTSNASFGTCNTSIPRLQIPGLIPGANLIATHGTCTARAAGVRVVYRKCMAEAADRLAGVGLISASQAAEVKLCAR